VVWYTGRLREDGLLRPLVAVEDGGIGVAYCLDTRRADAAGEAPVGRWDLGVPAPEQDLRPRFASSADFALTKLRQTAEDEGW
jgi:hypothetical protein